MPNINELTLAKELIKFPSVTPVDAGAIGFLAKQLRKLGFDCKILEFKDKNRISKPIKNIYARLGKLPVSLSKINLYSRFIYNLDLENKELFLYTPNVKIHIFQILIFYKKDFNYRLLEEGSGSFKNINETELLFNKNIKLFFYALFFKIQFHIYKKL